MVLPAWGAGVRNLGDDAFGADSALALTHAKNLQCDGRDEHWPLSGYFAFLAHKGKDRKMTKVRHVRHISWLAAPKLYVFPYSPAP